MHNVFEKGIYQNIQKYTRFVMMVAIQDVEVGTTSGFSRAVSTAGVGGLSVERSDYFKIKAPDRTPLANTKNTKIYDVFSNSAGISGTARNISDEQMVST
jgi:hypothetical protein